MNTLDLARWDTGDLNSVSEVGGVLGRIETRTENTLSILRKFCPSRRQNGVAAGDGDILGSCYTMVFFF